jgi:DNA-binding MarR family transcriptional regulator
MRKVAKRSVESPTDTLGREAFIGLYLAANRLTAEVEQVCREEQLTMSHYTILWFLERRGLPEGVPMGAVIDGHINRASDSTRLADRLTSLGMIERLASPNDRRVVLVRLTKKGRETYRRLTAGIQELHRRQWAVLPPSDLEQLRRILFEMLDDDVAGRLRTLTATGTG